MHHLAKTDPDNETTNKLGTLHINTTTKKVVFDQSVLFTPRFLASTYSYLLRRDPFVYFPNHAAFGNRNLSFPAPAVWTTLHPSANPSALQTMHRALAHGVPFICRNGAFSFAGQPNLHCSGLWSATFVIGRTATGVISGLGALLYVTMQGNGIERHMACNAHSFVSWIRNTNQRVFRRPVIVGLRSLY